MLPLTPTKLGRYEIVDEIGKGAMGIVYLARDPLIGRLVALKTFRIGYSVKDQELEQFRIRFLREAQSAGILTHPNIVTIHDVVEQSEDGLAFIAMEYVRGTNLKQILQGDQPLTLQFVVDVVAQVGEALDYAHSNRVIHRDVKPANILITGDNRVKITDFGIARIDTSNLTQEGQLLGTPNYMAPEQIQGKEVDWRADLFSLGVVLYEMLTRHKPFQGENLTVVSHRIVYDPFTPPRDYVRDVPPEVEKVLNRALEKDPARRYQRARDMMEDLRRLLAERSVRDDLNETQSLSQTVVLPPSLVPPLPPAMDPGTGTGVTTGTGGTFTSGLPPLPSLPEVPAASVPRPRQSSVRRLLAVGGAALALSILFWAGALLWISWTEPPPVAEAESEIPNPARGQYVTLMSEGHKAARAGDYGRAFALYSQAEQIAPAGEEKAQVRALRGRIETLASKMPGMIEEQKQIAAKLAEARKALKAGRPSVALAAVNAVLQADPKNPEAQDVMQEVEEALARSGTAIPSLPPGDTRLGEEAVAGTIPPSGTAPEAGGAASEPAAARKAMLFVVLESQSQSGTLIVRVDGKQALHQTLDFPGGKRGILGRRKASGPGSFRREIEVPGGYHQIQAHVALKGQPGVVKTFDGDFTEGSKSLEIQISESGQVTIGLR